MKCEWDTAKNDINPAKHGIDFMDAAQVFADRMALYETDERRDYGEIRTNIIGEVFGRIIRVTFTQRGDRVRIISARNAHRKERTRYAQRSDR